MPTDAAIRILGVDPGTLRLGFGLLEVRAGAVRLLASGVVAASPDWSTARRLGRFASELGAVIDAEHPTCLAVESSFFGKNVHSLIRLGEARGMVLALAGARDLEAHDYPPASVKRAVTGNGCASKEQVARVLAALLPELRSAAPSAPDRTDAIAVAWCHAQSERLRARRAAIDAAQKEAARGTSG